MRLLLYGFRRGPQMPHTPLTPGNMHTAMGGSNSGPPSVPPPPSSGQSAITSSADGMKSGAGASVHDVTTTVDLPSDLNFDPAAVIEGEAQGQEGLNVSTVKSPTTCAAQDRCVMCNATLVSFSYYQITWSILWICCRI